MLWKIIAYSAGAGALGFALGVIVGLSLGFRVGTQRAILIFKRHFPTSAMMNDVVRALLAAAKKGKP